MQTGLGKISVRIDLVPSGTRRRVNFGDSWSCTVRSNLHGPRPQSRSDLVLSVQSRPHLGCQVVPPTCVSDGSVLYSSRRPALEHLPFVALERVPGPSQASPPFGYSVLLLKWSAPSYPHRYGDPESERGTGRSGRVGVFRVGGPRRVLRKGRTLGVSDVGSGSGEVYLSQLPVEWADRTWGGVTSDGSHPSKETRGKTPDCRG